VLFVVVLVFFSLNLHKHRVAGNPFILGRAGPTHTATTDNSGEVTTALKSSNDKGKAPEEVKPAREKRAESDAVKVDDAAAIV
jgi:hypothetical protein